MAGMDYCFKSNNDFLRYKQGSKDIIIQKKFDSDNLRQVIQNPDAFLDKADILKNSRTTKAGISKFDNGTPFFIKRYNNKGLLFTLRYLFRKNHAFRAWQAAWFLQRWSVPTPDNFAVINIKPGNLILKSAYLITASIDATVPTLDFFKIMIEDKSLLKEFINKAASFLAPLHCWGIRHLDFKLSNIFATTTKEGNYHYGLWDLDGIILTNKPLSTELRSTDIARLYASFHEVSKQTGLEIDINEIKNLICEAYRIYSGFDLNQQVMEEKKSYFIKKREKRYSK